jgi:hypothetical protein
MLLIQKRKEKKKERKKERMNELPKCAQEAFAL